jgi:hypothetical protein
MTPTWTDPINDTHKFGLWSYYQGCLYGDAGCTNPNQATTRINSELSALKSQRDTLLSTYSNNMVSLKSGIDADMAVVNQRKASVDAAQAVVNVRYGTMSTNYNATPEKICGLFCATRPALGEKYDCGVVISCGSNAAVKAYNDSLDNYTASTKDLSTAQQNLSASWSVSRNGVTLSQRASDYDKFVQLCGAQGGSATTCVSGTITRTEKNVSTVQLVAGAMQNSSGTRIQGLDIGIATKFTLPSVAYNSNGSAGATTTRTDFFSIALENFTLNGSYLNLWGDAAGLKASMSLQMYADKLIIAGCENCADTNKVVAKNVYFDLNLGDANYQPATLSVASNGDLMLSAPGVTWANHEAFYQNVQKSNISIGNLNISGTDLGSQAIRGLRIDYLNVRTVNLPR